MMTSTQVAGCGLLAFSSLALAGLLLSAGIVSPQDVAILAFKTVDSMEARVQGCVTCHGQSGQGTSNEYFPRIVGKPAAYGTAAPTWWKVWGIARCATPRSTGWEARRPRRSLKAA
jgi:cytochrome c553